MWWDPVLSPYPDRGSPFAEGLNFNISIRKYRMRKSHQPAVRRQPSQVTVTDSKQRRGVVFVCEERVENKGGGWIRPLSWRRCRPQQQQQQQQLSVRNQVVFGLSPHYSTQSRRSSSQVLLLRRQKTFGSLVALGFLSAWDFAGCRQLCRERPADRKT